MQYLHCENIDSYLLSNWNTWEFWWSADEITPESSQSTLEQNYFTEEELTMSEGNEEINHNKIKIWV